MNRNISLKIARIIGRVIGYTIMYPMFKLVYLIYGKDVLYKLIHNADNRIKNLTKRA